MEAQEHGQHTSTHSGRVYVLRIWQESGAGDAAHRSLWRASVREGTRGPRRYFANIDDCIDHLYSEFIRPQSGAGETP